MAKATVVRETAPIKKVVLEMSGDEARYLLQFIDRHVDRWRLDGPVTEALRKALK